MFNRKKKKAAASSGRSGGPLKGLGTRLAALCGNHGEVGEEFFQEFEDLLAEADFGPAAALDVSKRLRSAVADGESPQSPSRRDIAGMLKTILAAPLRVIDLTPGADVLTVHLVLGVNGVGKTTTIAKLAHRFKPASRGVVLAAGDTFRAAAADQLGIHAERTGVRIVKQQQGSDPGAVIYDAIESARSRGSTLVLADTAGRMHNRVNLVNELEKIDRIVRERLNSTQSVYRKILIIDATTGQNGMRQVETFHESVGVDALIMTKYDSTARGGIIASIARRFDIPVAFLGCGEGMNDLIPFETDRYLDELLSYDGT